MRPGFISLRSWFVSPVLLLPLSLSACSGDPTSAEVAPADLLRLQFSDQAALVLEHEGTFVATERGFATVASPTAGPWRSVELELPHDSTETLRFRGATGGEIRVREKGAEGVSEQAENAIAYRRAGGTSFWTTTPGGVEEWLHVEAGAVRAGEPIAAWEVEGADLRLTGDTVEVVNDRGVVEIRVTAPVAYAAGGRKIGATLAVNGGTIELSVDAGEAGGDALLVDPAWTTAGWLSGPRQYHTATLLGNGKVLVAGGLELVDYLYVSEATLYDPVTNTWTAAPPMSTVRGRHTATLLTNGKVLVVGGNGPGTYEASAELYDPATNAWQSAGAMSLGRLDHKAVRLLDGRVLVVGGYNSGAVANVDLYDPVTNSWAPAAPLSGPRSEHFATLLGDGRVLTGCGYAWPNNLTSTEIYDPNTNTWSSGGAGPSGRFPISVTLADGRVLLLRGFSETTTRLYNPANNTWAVGPTMSFAHVEGAGALLGDGRVLIAGGNYRAVAEILDPVAGAWTLAEPMTFARSNHTLTPLLDGTVLAVGNAPNAERYDLAATVPGHLIAAKLFVDNVQDIPAVQDNPDTNQQGSPASIDWVNFTGVTQGATLFTLALQHSDPTITSSVVKSWWGATRPNSVALYNQIIAQNHFTRITSIQDVRPGDLLAITYSNVENTGHAAIIEIPPSPLSSPINPVVPNTTQFQIGVIDSTTASHNCDGSDTRWVPSDPAHSCQGGTTDGGAGRGTMRLYADTGTGAIVGYAWSLNPTTVYYPQVDPPQPGDRVHAIGRFVK